MTNQEKDIALITRFLDLDLSDTELSEFEKRLSEDLEFEKKFQTYLEAHTLVNDLYTTNKERLLTQQWQNILNKKETYGASKKIIFWKWAGSIAAGLIILISIWQLKTPFQEPDMSNLLQKAWNKDVGLDYKSLRSIDKDSIKIIITSAFDAYYNKTYQLAIDTLSNFDSNTGSYEDILLIKGLSHYKIGYTDIALKTLDTLANYPTEKKSKVARWYQGLIYLEMGNMDAAQEFVILPNNINQDIKLKE